MSVTICPVCEAYLCATVCACGYNLASESAEDAMARARRDMQHARWLLLLGTPAPVLVWPLWIFPWLQKATAAAGFTLLVFTMLGGLPQGIALFLSAWWRLRRLARLPAARVVQRGNGGGR